jgi:hypothetical protein
MGHAEDDDDSIVSRDRYLYHVDIKVTASGFRWLLLLVTHGD